MPLNTHIDVKNPSAFTIRNHAFGSRPATAGDARPAGSFAGAAGGSRNGQSTQKQLQPGDCAQ